MKWKRKSIRGRNNVIPLKATLNSLIEIEEYCVLLAVEHFYRFPALLCRGSPSLSYQYRYIYEVWRIRQAKIESNSIPLFYLSTSSSILFWLNKIPNFLERKVCEGFTGKHSIHPTPCFFSFLIAMVMGCHVLM